MFFSNGLLDDVGNLCDTLGFNINFEIVSINAEQIALDNKMTEEVVDESFNDIYEETCDDNVLVKINDRKNENIEKKSDEMENQFEKLEEYIIEDNKKTRGQIVNIKEDNYFGIEDCYGTVSNNYFPQ